MPKIPSESMEFVQDVQVKQHTTLILNYAFVSQVLATLMEFVLLVVELIKFCPMEFAAAKLDFTLLLEFVVSVLGTKSMIKVLVFAEFLVIKKKSIIVP